MRPVPRLWLMMLLCLSAAMPAAAQSDGRVITGIPGYSLQQTANGVLGLLGYNVVPDTTASSLSISRGGQEDTGLQTTQFGLGFTVAHDGAPDPEHPHGERRACARARACVPACVAPCARGRTVSAMELHACSVLSLVLY